MNDGNATKVQLYEELERKGLFGTVFREAAIGIALASSTGEMLACNPALQRMLGYSEAELCSRTIGEISFPADVATDDALFRELFRGERAHYHLRKRYVHRDGHVVWGHLTVSLVRDAAGEPQMVIGMVQDITEQERAAEALQEAYAQLDQTEQQLIQAAKLAAVGELVAGVAHELNNPLASILGYTEVLLQECAPEDAHRRDLEIIAAEARRTRVIVRNLLGFARPAQNLRAPVDVNELLRRPLGVLRPQLQSNGVRIVESYAADLGPVYADEGQMMQVFLNLISNAGQSMPEGGTLSLRTALVGAQVAVAITDTGTGIAPENLERLFEPFFSTRSAGTGLGLAISQGIVQKHGGRITVESEVGQGSTFTVWLPAGAPVGPIEVSK